MNKFAVILSLLLFALLAAARLAAPALILAAFAPPYGTRIVSALGVLTVAAAALVLDRLVRAFYWDGYLRHKRGRETPVVIEGMLTVALLALSISVGLYFEAGVSFTGFLTASGATAIILGIALQAIINDVFSGVSVNIDGSFAIGDWLTIYAEEFPEPIYGRVQGIAWRATTLRLSDGRLLMIPNHALTANPVMNHSRPPGPKRLFVEIPVSGNFPAGHAMVILLAEAYRAVRSKPLSSHREPEILIDRFDSDSTFLHVRFYADVEESDPQSAKSVMAAALHRALLRHRVPSPVSQVELVSPSAPFRGTQEEEREALSQASLFENILDEAQLHSLALASEARSIPAGTALIRQGDAGTSMFILLEGAARVSIAMPDGETREVAVLASGDVVGEMSLLTGAPRTASVTSLTAMRLLEVTKEAMEPLLAAEPNLMDRFSHVLAVRQSNLSAIASTRGQKHALQRDILAQMRDFFSRAFG
jgi:small-conductance mechanosensitive channel/CRP-like cAMP-binding protein